MYDVYKPQGATERTGVVTIYGPQGASERISSATAAASIGVQELLPIPPTVIKPGLGACNRCDQCL